MPFAGRVAGRRVNRSIDKKQHFILCLMALVALVVVGTAGFRVFGGRSFFESLYLTVVILTTVGMKESDQPLTDAEQGWAIVLMLVGVGAVLYASVALVAFLIDGDMRRLLGRRKVNKRIDRLHGHTVICGFGRMGRALAKLLTAKGEPFVVIDNDLDRAEEAEQLGYLFLLDDAMSDQALRAAHADQARGLVACLPDDADNVFVALTAREMAPGLLIISRAERMGAESKLRRAGADRVICAPVLTANRVMHMLLQPAIDDLLELMASGEDPLTIVKVAVADLPKAVGRSLSELNLRSKTGMSVVAIIRPDGRRQVNPIAGEKLDAGAQLILLGPTAGIDRVLERFAGGG